MSRAIQVAAGFEPTPAELAAAFWEMDAEQQADFFASLDEIAGVQLCSQMAGVVEEITARSGRGDYSAMNGFRTMLAHSQAYHEAATEIRCWEAMRELTRAQGGA